MRRHPPRVLIALLAPASLARSILIAFALALYDVRGSEDCGCREALVSEVAALRAKPLPFLVALGDPYPARQVLANRKLRPGGGNATCADASQQVWRLKADIGVKKGPYRKEHRVILEVPPRYPSEQPKVRFGSKITSAYLRQIEEAHSSIPAADLVRVLHQTGQGSLRGLFTVLHDMLTKPLEGVHGNWHASAKDFQEETHVARKYRKKQTHKHLFTVTGLDADKSIDASLLAAIRSISIAESVDAARASLLSSGVISEVIPGMVYSFPVFTESFCSLLMEEIRGFYRTKLPARRPNSMNNYGIILNDIGMEPFIFALQDQIVQPLAAVLFPKEGSELESHHSFTVRYKGDEDTHLDVHTDDSDVTFNVNIFGDYEGCPLVFCGLVGAPDHRQFRTAYQHKVGHAVMHSGRHRHGAEDITGGERMNLIVWSYSYNFRMSAASKKKHKREQAPPHSRCLSYTHDRDFGRFREFPPGKRERFFGRGWCPQRGKEYSGFVPDVPESNARRRGEL